MKADTKRCRIFEKKARVLAPFRITIFAVLVVGSMCPMSFGKEEPKESIDTLYLLRKFESIWSDAKFISANMDKMNPKLLKNAVGDLYKRLESFQLFKHDNRDVDLWGNLKGEIVGDAVMFVSHMTDLVAHSISGVSLDDLKKPGFFQKDVVVPLEKIHKRLLFLNGKAPTPWGDQKNEKPKLEEENDEPAK